VRADRYDKWSDARILGVVGSGRGKAEVKLAGLVSGLKDA